VGRIEYGRIIVLDSTAGLFRIGFLLAPVQGLHGVLQNFGMLNKIVFDDGLDFVRLRGREFAGHLRGGSGRRIGLRRAVLG